MRANSLISQGKDVLRVMINFRCPFNWVRDAQEAGRTLFLCVSVKMFLGEI